MLNAAVELSEFKLNKNSFRRLRIKSVCDMVLVRPERSLIFLVGFMASGKTTTGKYLADALGLKFFDLDVEIERRIDKPISAIFKEDGAAFFREIEHETLKELLLEKFAVISLGGGTITQDENLELVKGKGVIICLKTEVNELWERISNSDKRRLIVGDEHPTADLIYRRIEFLLSLRKPFYDQADIFVDTTNKHLDEVLKEILMKLELIW